MLTAHVEELIAKAHLLIEARQNLDALIAAVGKPEDARDPYSVLVEFHDARLEEAKRIPLDIIVLGLHRMAEEAARQATVAAATLQATRPSVKCPQNLKSANP